MSYYYYYQEQQIINYNKVDGPLLIVKVYRVVFNEAALQTSI